ncbi:glycoside hydrolase family protein [Dyella koreensis]|uniref:Glycosidase n=1 Tax=Dyella koreensis TaxID=311235 RepID=A0ABW8K853_9GAMM
MTAWTKKGLVFETSRQGVGGWMAHSALTPTPYRINEDVIRVYAGFRDADGVSRIGYVDVRADDPSRVVRVSAEPVLDIGRDGCFDDNGVILGDVVDAPGGLHMFYVGFQRVAKAKFLAFTGLAISRDGGERFVRAQETPILDRAPGRSTIGAIHTAIREAGRWRLWYAVGDDWELIDGQPFPRYHIRHVETSDLTAIPRDDQECLRPHGSEYRIGRPRVYRLDDGYVMYFTRGNINGEYFPGVAFSRDGLHWKRCDEALGLPLSVAGWDSRQICYPALIRQRDRMLMFYNGNDMGVDGFGLAIAPQGQINGDSHARG